MVVGMDLAYCPVGYVISFVRAGRKSSLLNSLKNFYRYLLSGTVDPFAGNICAPVYGTLPAVIQ
jgi:hypothetical protein